MRALGCCIGIGILVTAACGGGSGSSSTSTGARTSSNGSTNSNGRNQLTGQCTGQTSSETCAGEDAYVQCLETACDSQLKGAFGSTYASGLPSGPCGPYIACELVCPCDATASACESNCYATDVTNNASCSAAFLAVSSCVLNAACTTPVCATTAAATNTTTSINTRTLTNTATSINTRTLTSTASSTNTATPNCAALTSCCDTLVAGPQAAAYEPTCNQLASYGDAVCLQVLSGWEQSGVCGTGAPTSTLTATNTTSIPSTATLISTATITRTVTSTASSTNTATTNCAGLVSCCDVLLAGQQAATYQQSCAQLTTAGDAVCVQILSSWQQAGICK